MSFSPHDNQLQLKRRVPKGTFHRCWDFAFHANLLMNTREIYYLRTKSKNKILKPSSQGSIWKANRANVRSMHFHIHASSSGGPWDGSSSNGKEKEARQRAPNQWVFSQPYFQWSHTMGQHQEDKLLFSLLSPFCFLWWFGGSSQLTKEVFQTLVT